MDIVKRRMPNKIRKYGLEFKFKEKIVELFPDNLEVQTKVIEAFHGVLNPYAQKIKRELRHKWDLDFPAHIQRYLRYRSRVKGDNRVDVICNAINKLMDQDTEYVKFIPTYEIETREERSSD